MLAGEKKIDNPRHYEAAQEQEPDQEIRVLVVAERRAAVPLTQRRPAALAPDFAHGGQELVYIRFKQMPDVGDTESFGTADFSGVDEKAFFAQSPRGAEF